jgi:hypothetical protein
MVLQRTSLSETVRTFEYADSRTELLSDGGLVPETLCWGTIESMIWDRCEKQLGYLGSSWVILGHFGPSWAIWVTLAIVCHVTLLRGMHPLCPSLTHQSHIVVSPLCQEVMSDHHS